MLRPQGEVRALIEALELMVSVRVSEPEIRREPMEPLPFLLRDFRLAVSAGDADGSERLLKQVEATGLLSSENLRFLLVERLAKLQRWHELGTLPWFAELAKSRRPRHVTDYLLDALWRREFDDTVLSVPGGPLRRFEAQQLGSQFRSLLDAVDIPASVGGRRLVWLDSIVSGSQARADRLRQGVDEPKSVCSTSWRYGPRLPRSTVRGTSMTSATSWAWCMPWSSRRWMLRSSNLRSGPRTNFKTPTSRAERSPSLTE